MFETFRLQSYEILSNQGYSPIILFIKNLSIVK